MLKKGFVATIILAMLLFIGASQECMAAKKKKDQKLKDCQGKALMPVDESASFIKFRERLLNAVKDKNFQSLDELIHPEIEVSYPRYDKAQGDIPGTAKKGKEAFLKKWKFDDPQKVKSSPFWREMEMILEMGGSFKGQGTFEAPYVHSEWPANCERMEYGAIVGKDVPILPNRNLTGTQITTLSHQIVKVDYTQSDSNSVKITIPNGATGYIESKFIRSYYDYSVRFVKFQDTWLITFFAEVPKQDRGIPPSRP